MDETTDAVLAAMVRGWLDPGVLDDEGVSVDKWISAVNDGDLEVTK